MSALTVFVAALDTFEAAAATFAVATGAPALVVSTSGTFTASTDATSLKRVKSGKASDPTECIPDLVTMLAAFGVATPNHPQFYQIGSYTLQIVNGVIVQLKHD